MLLVAPQKQARFPTDKLPPYPTKSFKCRNFRFDPDKRPCNLFWLSPDGCPHADCTYSHDTPFTFDEFKAYRLWVKTTICPDMQRRKRCKLSDAECSHGHRCPHALKDCPHVRKGKCHYEQAKMPHSEPADNVRQ